MSSQTRKPEDTSSEQLDVWKIDCRVCVTYTKHFYCKGWVSEATQGHITQIIASLTERLLGCFSCLHDPETQQLLSVDTVTRSASLQVSCTIRFLWYLCFHFALWRLTKTFVFFRGFVQNSKLQSHMLLTVQQCWLPMCLCLTRLLHVKIWFCFLVT